MNVTPLVDVVLVLLIIFMVVTPLLTKQFWVHTPKQEKEEVKRRSCGRIRSRRSSCGSAAERTVTVNGADVALDELAQRLKRMFAARDDHILFFDAADDVDYGFAVEVMDQAREGGAVTIAALTAALTAEAAPAVE